MLVARTAAVVLLALAPSAPAQILVPASPSQLPKTASFTENVDFGDIDRDGDWDALLADGGDFGNDQNRCYVNLGGPPGPGGGGAIGFFGDQTATRMPVVSDDSRDIELGDFDGDGDLDVYTSNTAQVSNQSNRWLINRGGIQGGSEGFFDDETALRWVGLSGPGSSVAPSVVLAGGGFIDWSCDCDFADLDADGDLDLVHSTYGPAFTGTVPTRVFRNDGGGFFGEFNPGGFQLPGVSIPNGVPALWAEGNQLHDTTDTTGATADIAALPLGVELADVDGDLDIDVVHGSRNSQPRLFQNRLTENGGSILSFRDVTGAPGAVGAAWSVGASGADNYEQELGDMDRDGDVDAYMGNYVSLEDDLFDNPGNGRFGAMQVMPSSNDDDDEGDFLDYDGDGDLDLMIAASTATNRLYRNEYSGGGPGTFAYTLVASATSGLSSAFSLDSDCADVDFDGDTDVLTAEDDGKDELLYLNTFGAVDAFAPYYGSADALADQTSAAGAAPIRRQIYDNAPYYVNWYLDTRLVIRVDGCRLPYIFARSSQGQVYRALLPKNLQGGVSVQWRASDEYGNTSDSPAQTYVGTSSLAFESHFGVATSGVGGAPDLDALSVPFAGSTLYLGIKALPPSTLYWIAIAAQKLDSPIPLPGLFTLNVAGSLLLMQGSYVDASGCGFLIAPIPPGVPPGITVFAQGFGLNGTGGNMFSATDGLQLTTQ